MFGYVNEPVAVAVAVMEGHPEPLGRRQLNWMPRRDRCQQHWKPSGISARLSIAVVFVAQ